jgi:hypothetical protein
MKINKELLLVFYIDVRQVAEDEIGEFMHGVGKQLKVENGFYLPIMGESRVECINPKYITDNELIKKHERLMAELHEHLKNQLDNE